MKYEFNHHEIFLFQSINYYLISIQLCFKTHKRSNVKKFIIQPKWTLIIWHYDLYKPIFSYHWQKDWWACNICILLHVQFRSILAVKIRKLILIRNKKYWLKYNFLIIKIFSWITGGELFAKRRKKADKWVVDEGTLKSNPSQLADQFFVQQQNFQQQDYQVW